MTIYNTKDSSVQKMDPKEASRMFIETEVGPKSNSK